LRKSKLISRDDGPFKILEKINDNAYKEEDDVPSRMTSIQEGEDDENITTSDTTPFIELQGPITRSQAQQLHR
jgi:hypothetical protein